MNYRKALEAAERNIYLQAYRHYGFNQTLAARALGVSRNTFRKKMKQWELL